MTECDNVLVIMLGKKVELGKLFIDVGVSESSLTGVENRLKKRAAKISDFILRPRVDETSLTKLNNHLDLKIAHLKSVNTYFSQNRITPQVDFSNTSKLKSELQSILYLQRQIISESKNLKTIDYQTQSTKYSSATTDQNQSIKPPTQSQIPNTNISVEEIRRASELSTNQLLLIVNKTVAQGFKKAASTNPLDSFATGLFEGFGKSLSDDLVKGAKKSIKSLFNFDVSKFVEEELTKVANPIRTKQARPPKTKKQRPINQEISSENFYTSVSIPELTEKEKITEIVENVKSATTIIKAITTKNFSKVINESLKVISREINKEKPNVEIANLAFGKIRESFKTAYAQMNKAISAGNINLAESYAKTILKTSNQAFADIDQIVKAVTNAGNSGSFGSPIKTFAGSTKGVLTSKYVNPSKRVLNSLGNREDRQQFVEIGKQVVSGVSKGLTDSSPVTREVSNISFTILNAFRKTLGIQSPSKKAYEIGKLIVEGLKLGVTGDVNGLKNVAKQIALQILPTKESIRRTVATIAPNLLPRTFAERRERLEQQEAAYPESLKTRRTNFLGFKDGKYVGIPGAEGNYNFDYLRPRPGLGSETFFEGIFDKGARLGTKAIAKGFKTQDAPETVARQAAVMALTNKPEWIAGALASPLAIPLLPTYMALKVAKNILTPVVSQVYSALQQTSTTILKLSNISGNEEGGKRELNYVKGISNKYAVDLKGSANSYSAISFATKGTKLEGEDTKKLFEGISAATKYVGADASRASLIFSAFTQIISKGKVSMEELRLQLAESFPPAMQVFAKAIGKSVPELTDLISKGAILSEDILPKVADVLLKDFSKGASSAAASFVEASNRIQNAFFDFQLKITDSFGGMVTGVINLGANIFEGINSKIDGIGKAFNLLAISLIASTAAGFSTILGHEMFASKLKVIQNLFAVTFRRTTSLFTPFIAGTFIDLIDDFFGVKNSATDNVAKGVTNFVTGIFTGIDSITRGFNKKGLFSVGLTDADQGILDGLKNSMQQLFKIVPAGVVEMAALVLMFQQCALLAHTYVVPSLVGIGNSLRQMGMGVLNAVANFGNLRDSMKDFFPIVFAQAKNAAGALIGLGLNAAAALGVMSLAQSDFSNPLQKSFDQARSSIKGSLDAISSDLNKLRIDAEGVGKSIKQAIQLPSKGLELNLSKILGLSEDSFKSDDLIRSFNESGFVKGATRFKDYLEEKTLPVEQRSKTLREQKSKNAETLGLSGYFKNDDKYSTLAQDQLLNNAKELSKQHKDLNTRLVAVNLSPETIGNFQTGGTKKAIDDLRTLDKEIYNLSARRSQISLGTDTQGFNDPKTKKELATIDAEINTLTEKRKVQGKTLGNIFGGVTDIKTQLSTQLKAIEDANIPQSAKNALKSFVQPQIEEIDRVVKYLKDNKLFNLVQPLASVWQEVTDKLTTAENAFTRLQKSEKLRSLTAQTQINIGNFDTEGNRQQLLDTENLVNLDSQERQIAEILKTRTEALQKLLAISNVENAPNSKDDIKALRENIDKDKESLAETRLHFAQARISVVAKLKDQVKQVNEFYRNLNRQVETQAIESQKISISVNASSQQNKLRQILTGSHDTIVGQFLESVISSIDSSTSSSQAALDAQSQLLQNQFQLQDNLRSGDELARSLPGFTEASPAVGNIIDSEKFLLPIKNALIPISAEAKAITTQANTEIKNITEQLTNGKAIVTQTSAEVQNVKNQITNAKTDLTQINQTTNTVSEVFKSWIADIKTIPGILNSAFSNISTYFDSLNIGERVKKSLNTTLDNVAQRMGEFSSFADSKVESLGATVTNLSLSVSRIFTESIPSIATQISENLDSGINTGIVALQNAAYSVANAFLGINSENVSTLVDDIRSTVELGLSVVLTSFNAEIDNTINNFGAGVSEIIDQAGSTFNNISYSLNKGFDDSINNLVTGIKSGIDYFVSGIGSAVTSIMDAIKSFGAAIASFNPQAVLQDVGDAVITGGDAVYNGLGAVRNTFTNLTGIGKTDSYQIFDSNNGRTIKSYEDITRHHANRGRESGRSYGIAGGKQEEINASGFVKKDFVLKQHGADNVPVRSPASGFARLHSPLGQVGIYDQQQGGTLLAKVLHLARFNVKEGQQVRYGENLGIQGTKGGNSTGVHLHVELPINQLKKYVSDLISGNFTTESKTSLSRPSQNLIDPRQNMIDTRQSSNINFAHIAKNNNLQSILVSDLKGNQIGEYNSNKSPASPASTIKLIIGDIVTDRLNPNLSVSVNKSAIAENSNYKEGQILSVKELLTRMLKDSDNTAANVLIQSLGGLQSTNRFIKNKGYSGTELNNLLSIPNKTGFGNKSTAQDVTKAILNLINNESEGGKISENALRQTRNFNYQGERGGKIGNNSRVIGNVGIISIDGKEYIVTEYANVNGNTSKNKKLITNSTNEIRQALLGKTSIANTDTNLTSGNTNVSNITKYLHQIGYAESGFKNLPSNSAGATGYFQFTPEVTRIARSYGVNPRSANIQEAANATAVFIKRYHPKAYAAIESGDFKQANYLLARKTNEWTSLPGGRESNWGKNNSFSMSRLATFESGNFVPKFNVSGASTPINGVTGNYRVDQGTKLNPIQVRNTNTTRALYTSGSRLQETVGQANSQAQQIAIQRAAQIRTQEKQRIEKEKQDRRVQDERAIRQLKEASRQLRIETSSDAKQDRDAQFATIFNPTADQRNSKAESDIKYEISTILEAAEHKLETVTANRQKAEDALKNTSLPEAARKELENQLPTYRASEKALAEHIKNIKVLQSQRLAFQKQTADREETLRARDQSFSERQGEIDKLQEQINKYTTLKTSSPNNSDVQNLPDLQRVLDIKKEGLATDRKLAQLNDDFLSHKITKPSYDRQVADEKQRSQTAKDSIQLRSSQALTQQEIDNLRRDLDRRKTEQDNFSTTATLNLQTLLNKPASINSEDLNNARKKVYESEVSGENLSHENKRLEYKQIQATDNSQPERIKKLFEDQDKIHAGNLEQIRTKYEQQLAIDKSDRAKLRIEVQSQINEQRDRINTATTASLERLITKTPSIDLRQTLKLSALRERTYQNQVDTQEQNYLEESNKIDDLEINNKRTPEQIKELRDNLATLNKITLDSFKATLEDALNTDSISRFQKRIDQVINLQYLESSGLEARKAKIVQNVSRGGNPFINNRSQREIGAIEEDRRYILEGLETDKKIAELQASGENIPDTEIEAIKENLFQIHNINLDNLSDQFKTFGRTIDDIAKSGLQGLSQSIADVIIDGGNLGEVFQNLFRTIANGFIKNGLDSLIGGLSNNLFGGGHLQQSSGLSNGLLGGIDDILGGGIFSILGFSSGGTVPAISGGNLRYTSSQIGDALRREGNDSVLATLTPGERVLTKEENRIYNTIYPSGIKTNYKAFNFNEGGEIGAMSRQITNKFTSMGTSNNPVINIQNESQNYTGNEKQSVKLIRAVVVAELARQNSPGGINNKSRY